MKKNLIVLFILICCIACSNGQNKNSTNSEQDLSTEILGCWKAIGAYYVIKSNYPNMDSLSLENLKLDVTSEIQASYITRFDKNNLVRFYNPDGTRYGTDSYYEIEKDSLSIEDLNTLRKNTRSTSKISISNDTLYHEIDALGEVKRIVGNLAGTNGIDIDILMDIKIEIADRYTTFVRVTDCDKYKKEEGE